MGQQEGAVNFILIFKNRASRSGQTETHPMQLTFLLQIALTQPIHCHAQPAHYDEHNADINST